MVSVIIPIYNVEKYLEECVESVLCQTYQNLEIILVDDGSPDGCGAICEEYAQKDKRVKVIHKENGGLSDARNAGLDVCRGDYIVFADSDDCIHPQMIERLYNLLLKYQADMAICSFQDIGENEMPLYAEYDAQGKEYCLEKENIMNQLQSRNLLTVVAWNKIYKARLFENIRYPKGYIHEDEFIIHKLLHLCTRTVYTEEKLYYYRKRGDSIMGNISPKKIQDIYLAYEDRISFLEENQYGRIITDTKLQLMHQITKYYKLIKKRDDANELLAYMGDKFAELYQQKEVQEALTAELKKEYGLFYQSPSRYYAYVKKNKVYSTIKERIKKGLKSIPGI